MVSQTLMDEAQFERVIDRLTHQLLEHHDFFKYRLSLACNQGDIGLRKSFKQRLQDILKKPICCGGLDVTFHRDDFRRRENPISLL